MSNKTIKQLPVEHTSLLADDWLIAQKDADSVTGKIRASNVYDGGWKPLSAAPSTVTALGNNSFTVLFPSVDYTGTISNGMRVRVARTVAAPIECATFDGVNDYFSKTSPNKLSATNDIGVGVWVYLTSYQLGGLGGRYNGTSGFTTRVNADGTVSITGYNAGAANYRRVTTYQSVPLNRWVHIMAQIDMDTATATPTTNSIMFDGVDVPVALTSGGTAPTAIIAAGSLEIGWQADSGFFAGYMAQFSVYTAKVTQATILASINRGLSGSETSLASAYSFSNSITDLNTTTPNNLTANGGVVATTANSPFGNRGVSTTLEYGIVMANTFSTNTTVTVQVPEGCQLPTTGGITSVDYSTQNVPYGFPRAKDRWDILNIYTVSSSTFGAGTAQFGSLQIKIPSGKFYVGFKGTLVVTSNPIASFTVGVSSSTSSYDDAKYIESFNAQVATIGFYSTVYIERPVAPTTLTTYYVTRTGHANLTSLTADNTILYARNSYL